MLNAVELVGILCKIYLGAINIILIYFDLIKMLIFSCIDHCLQYIGPQWRSPMGGLKGNSLGTPDVNNSSQDKQCLSMDVIWDAERHLQFFFSRNVVF